MFGLKIFVRVQTFRQVPPVPPNNFCHPASAYNQSPPWGCVTIPYWTFKNQISSDMVCAGAAGKSSCRGDSGGPLTVKNVLTKKHDLVGVSSWTYGCAAVSCFLLFTRSLILLLRMDCTGCMPRWPSTGLGSMRKLLLMEAHLSALHNFLRFPMKLLYQSVTSLTSFDKMIIEVKSRKIV